MSVIEILIEIFSVENIIFSRVVRHSHDETNHAHDETLTVQTCACEVTDGKSVATSTNGPQICGRERERERQREREICNCVLTRRGVAFNLFQA